jgi:glyoxylase-like metal-dependent hydrolase (beta-lactamase superfamily II)
MSSNRFASQADHEEKQVSWEKLSDNAYAYTAEGDPNTGVIIGDDGVMIIDATATPVAAQGVIAKVREVTNLPIKYVVLTHYHAVRVLGASGFKDEGLEQIIASQDTYDLIVERGQQDMDSEIGRFPRLFQAVESVPGLTWPTMTFTGEMTLWLGKLEVKIKQIGRGHTKGDAIVYLPSQNICFSGDLVEADAACYTGDAYLADWPQTLDKLVAMNFDELVPGRGAALMCAEQVQAGLAYLSTFQYPKFGYVRPPELSEGRDGHCPVVIVGAGPVGLCAAIDLAQQASVFCCSTTTTRCRSDRAACVTPSARWRCSTASAVATRSWTRACRGT